MPILHCGTREFQAKVRQAAMEYASRGWRVVVLHGIRDVNGQVACTCQKGLDCPDGGKHPRLTGWPSRATCDEDAIAQLWECWPESNVGIRLGPESNLVDVEFDNAEGHQTAERLLGASFTPTYNSKRSVHRLYRFPTELVIPASVVHVQGLELRFGTDTRGQQSVFPPSVHASGVVYHWATGFTPNDVEVEAFPLALVELVAASAGGGGGGNGNGEFVVQGQHFWDTPGEKVGARNATLARLTGSYLAAYGTGDYANLLAHAKGWNTKCQPPKGDAEIEKVVRHIWKKEEAKQAARLTAQPEAVQPAMSPPAGPQLVSRKYSAIQAKPIEWLWENRIPRGMVTVLAGPGGWGKSTVASDLVARLTTGAPLPDGTPGLLGDALMVSA